MTGILLYPAVRFQLSESVNMQGHVLRWETIDLAQPWQNMNPIYSNVGAVLSTVVIDRKHKLLLLSW